jgi:protocatechuate 3,4-dioxygenase beta subunit
MTNESRRTFLLAGLAAVPLFRAQTSCANGGGESASGGGESAGVGVEKTVCRATEEGQYGPFYRAGAPWRTALCDADEAGEPLRIAGHVTSAAGCAPLAGATLDVWQANAEGFYDTNDPARPDPSLYRLRGRLKTDAEGRYQFETVLPGNYGQGRFVRARHIHLLVTCPGHEPLVTEIYFEGDRHNATDSLVRTSLITPLAGLNDGTNSRAGRKHLKGTFDIALVKSSIVNRV